MSSKKPKSTKTNQKKWKKCLEISNFEEKTGSKRHAPETAAGEIRKEISAVRKDEISFTLDTGAEETVCNETDGGNFPIIQGGKESETIYVMPDGRTVKNLGEKHLKVRTKEGSKFLVKTQVTTVRKPLMAVSKVCDEDNTVVFRKDGGYIENEVTKEKTFFKRVGNVYILNLKLMEDEAPPFRWPAK